MTNLIKLDNDNLRDLRNYLELKYDLYHRSRIGEIDVIEIINSNYHIHNHELYKAFDNLIETYMDRIEGLNIPWKEIYIIIPNMNTYRDNLMNALIDFVIRINQFGHKVKINLIGSYSDYIPVILSMAFEQKEEVIFNKIRIGDI